MLKTAKNYKYIRAWVNYRGMLTGAPSDVTASLRSERVAIAVAEQAPDTAVYSVLYGDVLIWRRVEDLTPPARYYVERLAFDE
jgi:hypothetical protein